MTSGERDDAAAGAATLLEPARLQVLELAAELLGRLPAEDVPSGLRAIARFAPAKRRRLGAVALSLRSTVTRRFVTASRRPFASPRRTWWRRSARAGPRRPPIPSTCPSSPT